MNDAGSLQNLNDIIVPGPVPWWPPAPGWYVLAAALALAVVFLAWRGWRGWRENRYRRQALQELAAIRESTDANRYERLPVLLKQAALAAWPREEVAALSGVAWHQFLDDTSGTEQFSGATGNTLDWLAYRATSKSPPGPAELERVVEATESWLKHHVRPRKEG